MRNGKASITRSGENSKVVRLQQPKEMFQTDSLANQNVPYYDQYSLPQFENMKRLKKQRNIRVLLFLQKLHAVKTFLQRFKMGGFSKFQAIYFSFFHSLLRIDFDDKKATYSVPYAPYYADNGSSTQVVIQYQSDPSSVTNKCPQCLGSTTG